MSDLGEQAMAAGLAAMAAVLEEATEEECLHALLHIGNHAFGEEWRRGIQDVTETARERGREARIRPAFERGHGPEVPEHLRRP